MTPKTQAQIFRDLKVGETHVFPIEKYSSIKVACYDYAIKLSRKYSSSINREAGTITVTRTA